MISKYARTFQNSKVQFHGFLRYFICTSEAVIRFVLLLHLLFAHLLPKI
jgi:hypothetical protein